MKTMQIDRFGGPEVLHAAKAPEPMSHSCLGSGMAYGNKRPYDFVNVDDVPYQRDSRSRLRCHHKELCFVDRSDHLHRRR